MREHIIIDQNTDEWFQCRAGRITASAVSAVMANYGKAFGEPAKKYAVKVALEQVTGQSLESNYTNDAMQRGHAEEPVARMLYSEERFVDVGEGGFFTFGADEGASPDGLVGDDGVLELKSAAPHIHYSRMKRGTIDSAYRWQCVMLLRVTGRAWVDLTSYCSSFPPQTRLFTVRMDRDAIAEDLQMMESRLIEFKQLIDEIRPTIAGEMHT